ncbi:DUF3598 family protein [Spirulina sp. 06S082]|uniref:DUF3598 family protein n=1 Tax=Spirulina sp. 06S082 TaxID=3110248 RepID=UPI002B210C6C|nr:DUF3598 family protein [Spirulina sp. 06S082]MEA5472467.1 DUF3598 family protein [Spirulina sp. 06S082]
MASQWQNLLKNIGEWQGSFTKFSPEGQQLEDVPSILILEGLQDNKALRLTLNRFPQDKPPYNFTSEFSSLNRSMLVFEDGAFSKGSMQWSPVSEFGGEFGLKTDNERLRLVQLYTGESQLQSITLMREKLAGTSPPQRPILTPEQLIGEWRGEATTLYRDWSSDRMATHLKIETEGRDRLSQTLSFGTGSAVKTLRSTAKIEGSRLHFEDSEQPYQILLLPNGASSNCPTTIAPRKRFVLELGWLVRPELRLRLIRSYSDRGEWVHSTLVREEKQR